MSQNQGLISEGKLPILGFVYGHVFLNHIFFVCFKNRNEIPFQNFLSKCQKPAIKTFVLSSCCSLRQGNDAVVFQK